MLEHPRKLKKIHHIFDNFVEFLQFENFSFVWTLTNFCPLLTRKMLLLEIEIIDSIYAKELNRNADPLGVK